VVVGEVEKGHRDASSSQPHKALIVGLSIAERKRSGDGPKEGAQL